MTNEKLKKIIPITDKSNLMQVNYFIYDHSNFVKKSFIIKINKFVFLYGSITYFDEKNLLEIALPYKTFEFEIEKYNYKDELTL